jgi:hypothetical protein
MEIDQAIRIWIRQYGHISGNKNMDQAVQCGDSSGNKDQAVWRWIRLYEYGSGSMELDQVPGNKDLDHAV